MRAAAIDWTTIWQNPWIDKPVYIVGVILVSLVARVALSAVIRRIVKGIVSGVKRRQGALDTQALQASPLVAVRAVQRTRTLGSVLSNLLTAVIAVIAVVLIVNKLSPDITGAFSLITAAIGAGLGFGAQNIVKDVLNGLMIVGEDQLGVGDVVDTGFATGVVEAVGIRTTQVRDVNGVLWYVRNGEMLRIGNMSQGWARVIIDLAVPYDADVDAVQERMLSTALDMAGEPKWKRVVMERPEVWGIESISAEAVVVRIVVKTRTGAKDDVARELRMRLKAALDDMGVKLPSLNQVVLTGFESAGSVRGARPPATNPIAVAPKRGRAPRAPKPAGPAKED